jgi:hypothetical protein
MKEAQYNILKWLLLEFLGLVSATILVILFCEVNYPLLLYEFTLKLKLYFITEWEKAQ